MQSNHKGTPVKTRHVDMDYIEGWNLYGVISLIKELRILRLRELEENMRVTFSAEDNRLTRFMQ